MWLVILVAAGAGVFYSLVRITEALLRDGTDPLDLLCRYYPTPHWLEVSVWMLLLALCGFVFAAVLIVRL